MDDTVIVFGHDFHGCVPLGGRGTTNHEGHLQASSFHLLRHVHHLIQRRSNQPRKSDDVHLLLNCFVEDVVARHHHSHVDHLEIVAPQHDTHDVLADVMHVSFHRCHQHGAVVLWLVRVFARGKGGCSLLFLHEGREVGHSLLHHTGALDNLRQEHLTRSEEVADDAHSLHQRPLDDMQRNFQVRTRLLSVLLNKLVDAIDKPVVQTLGEGAAAPRILGRSSPSRCGCGGRLADRLSVLEEALHVLSIRRLVEDHLLSQLPRVRINVRVARQTSGVHNRHVEALGHGVVEEDAVHGVAQGVEASEGEGQVAEAAGEGDARAGALDLCDRIDEVNGIRVVLREARGDRQHVAVEDDVFRGEVQVLPQTPVAALADADLVLERGSLALLIKSHDDHSSSVSHAQLCLAKELFLTDLQGNRVHDALALHALQSLLDHRPLG
mmetsp:Transcript_68863/g.161923  ORF Transcript_68863/g.161923 Transcript_68863/m.161923 type:complete len:438 (-) Transcript_68863:1840-3153(-)